MIRREKGSITVFLTLAGVLIFALMGTLVETARFGACANFAARTLRTSAEGLLTEYSRPLYEHYGLFFIEQEGTPYETVIAGYAGDMMETVKTGKMNFFQGTFREIRIADKVTAGDNKAGALQKEIAAYMGRRLAKDKLEQFCSKTKEIQNTEAQAQEIEDTVEEQKELAELDEVLLDLMKLIDGISVSGGNIYCETYFAKLFSTKKKLKGENFGVTEAAVFQKMKKKIDKTPASWKSMQSSSFLQKLKKVREVTEKAIKKGKKLKTSYAGIRKNQSLMGEKDHDKFISQIIDGLPSLRGNLRVLKETQTLLDGEMTEEVQERLEQLWKDYDTESIRFDYTGAGKSGGAENPLNSLSSAWGDGILNLVCKKTSECSQKSVSNPDYYAELYETESKEKEDYGNRVSEFVNEENVNLSDTISNTGSYAWDKFCLDSYVTEMFSSYMEKKKDWKHKLAYQWEYVIAGGKSDKSNLETVLNRILLIRTVTNFAAIYKDSAKKGEAYAVAAAIVGFTGMEPLIRLTQTFILIAWSMVESLVDIAGLLQKKNVPMVKKPSQILTSFSELFLLSGDAITTRAERFGEATDKTFGYEEYVKLFLLSMNQETLRYRIMDLIQWDMRKNGYGTFTLGSCVFSLTVSGTAAFPGKLFRLSPVERLLGREMKEYSCTCEISSSYI